MFKIVLKLKDGQKYECYYDKEYFNGEEIKKIAFEKIKKDIPDYDIFNYKIESVTCLNNKT